MRTSGWIFSLSFIFSLFIFSSIFATTPILTKWIKNISEGEGAPAVGMEDYAPEIAVSGKVIHLLWLTNNNWTTKQLNYRRSTDGGLTWETKKLFLDVAGLDDAARYQRMYVSGNYVHIAYIVKDGLGPSELFYLRSTNGGQSFEAPVKLYSVPQNIIELRVKGDGARLTIAAIHNCHYCGEQNIFHLFSSENNGASFEDRVVSGSFNAYTFTPWDLAVEGNNVYLLLMESVGYWADYNYNLHLFSSNNRGLTFKDNIISVPAQSGAHHPFITMDYNWGYTKKIAAEGDKVWAIWSGWNAENEDRIFVAGSNDAGNTFLPTKEISGELAGFQAGLETITVNGSEIYAAFIKTDGRIFVAKSHNSGATFDPTYEFTLKDDPQLRSGWGPSLVNAPNNNQAYLLRTGPCFGLLDPDNDYTHEAFIGNLSIRDNRYLVAAFDDDGILHIAYQGGRAWLSTGVFTDYEIFYRSIDPNFRSSGNEDKVLKLAAKENVGDGTGDARFDKMVVAQHPDLKFTEGMTIELWLKPELDRPATYITQNHNLTWNQGDVGGFILWSDGYQGLLPVTNMLTTTGRYPMSSKRKMQVKVWNHLAVTYDKNGGAQNFKLYLNGEVVASTIAAGDIASPDVAWIIGALGDTYYRNAFEGQMDELRFWNKARTREEIRQFMFEKPNPSEAGLMAYYDFNQLSPQGQVEDRTGKGHTGFLVYMEEIVPSTIEDIGVRFEYVQNGGEVFFNQKSNGGEVFEWNFGDTKTSTEVNPVHHFANPGNFEVCLTASGRENSGTYCETVIVKGIDRVYPTVGGNTGGITLNIFGGGFAPNSKAILRLAGQTDIAAFKNIFDPAGSVTAVFELTGKPIGQYDVIIKTGTSEQVLPKAFQLIQGEKAKPWVSYAGGGTLLVQRWTPQTIVLGNSANVDAYGVVLWVAVPDDPDFDIVFLNLNVQKPQLAIDRGWSDELDAMGLYVSVDSLFGKPSQSRLYSFYFPYLPAKSTMNISVRVRTKKPIKSEIQVAVSSPFYASPLSPYVQGCIAFAAAKACIKAGLGFIPGVPCITGTFSIISDVADDDPPTPSAFENIDVKSFSWNLGSTLFECATSLIPGTQLVSGTLSTITAAIDAKQEHEDCLKGFWPSPFSLFQIAYYGVTSLDPNEKKGPVGFAEENYIPVTSQASYQINFENKSTATAPAQEVLILDTLKSEFYDLKNFSFGPLGFGDSIFYPAPYSLEFGLEADLRPGKDILVRMTGRLDTLTRIVKWQFTTLDPDTRDLVIDALGGFLPPNVTAPEGEGFVSFSIGLNHVEHLDLVKNRASIVFDLNPPILTNEFVNSFDLEAPVSWLLTDEPVSADTTISMEIQGSDEGCGVRLYEIYASENGLPYELYRYTGNDRFDFIGDYGKSYRLYSIAVDSIGNKEPAPSVPDVEVSIVSGTRDLDNWEHVNVYPMPAGKSIFVEFPLEKGTRVKCSILDLNGMEKQILLDKNLPSGQHRLTIDLPVPDGFYLIRLQTADKIAFKKIVVNHIQN